MVTCVWHMLSWSLTRGSVAHTDPAKGKHIPETGHVGVWGKLTFESHASGSQGTGAHGCGKGKGPGKSVEGRI
jgi:hypothetical protein